MLPFKIGKFAIELDNSRHKEIDVLHQGRMYRTWWSAQNW